MAKGTRSATPHWVKGGKEMPQQEIVFEQKTGDGRIEILKVYDRVYAREAFGSMDETAQKCLWNSLGINETYDVAELSDAHLRTVPRDQDYCVESSDDEKRLVFGNLDNEPVANTDTKLGQQPAVSYDKIREHKRFN
jgi:hypothetical protein